MNYKDFFKEDLLPGGKGDNVSLSKFDPTEVKLGLSVEMEHTNDKKLAAEICKDHLTEDPHYYTKLKRAKLEEDHLGNPIQVSVVGISSSEPVKQIDKQTVPGTVFPTVDKENSKNFTGNIGNTPNSSNTLKTDVESPAKDPTPTDHITGAMTLTPVNTNILSKDNGIGVGQTLNTTLQSIIPKDIEIDVMESKKILSKLKKCDATEGYGGDPDTDKKYKDGKRWTVKW